MALNEQGKVVRNVSKSKRTVDRAIQQEPLLGRILASLGLSDVSSQRSPSELLELLQNGTDEERANAARQLGMQGVISALPRLEQTLKEDRQALVRAAAAYALGEFVATEIPLAALLEAMGDTDKQVRAAAAWALGEAGERFAQKCMLPLFSASYNKDEDISVRVAAVHALGNLGERVPIEWLIDALNADEWQLRYAAALELGRQSSRVPPGVLEDHLNDDNDFVRNAVLSLLTQDEQKELDHSSGEQSEPEDTTGQQGQEPETREAPETPEDSQSLQAEKVPDVYVDSPASSQTSGNKNVNRRFLTSGSVMFEALEPGDLALKNDIDAVSVPIVAQALDNQWTPLALSRALFSGKFTYRDVQPYLDGLIRAEYIRSLINGERVIINRAYLYNNPVLFNDYLLPGANRAAFMHLLEDGVITPFLLYERSPDEIPVFEKNEAGFAAWQRVCQDVRMQCIRFSWEEKAQQSRLYQFTSRFHVFISALEASKDKARLAADLGLPPDRAGELNALLGQMNDLSTRHYREQAGKDPTSPHITRNILYKHFVTDGPNPAERLYDPTKPLGGEVKQLFDLAYNGFLADALNGYLLTPVDSPTRMILQEWETAVKERTVFTGDDLLAILRSNAFALVQESLYLKSMGLLTLQDVQRIRDTEQWHVYIKSLQRLLKAPGLFVERAPEVYTNYVELARVMTQMISYRQGQPVDSLTAPWEPTVKIQANIGGSSLTVIWNRQGIFFHASDELPYVVADNGDAPLTMRLTIGDSAAGNTQSQAQLFSSVDIIKGKMPDALNEWRKIMRELGQMRRYEEYAPERVKKVNTPTINEQEQ